MLSEKAESVLILVQSGWGVQRAAKRVYTYVAGYYRTATEEEKKAICRARREYLYRKNTGDRVVKSLIAMPASRREKLQRICTENGESVNAFVNRLITHALKDA